MASRFDEEGMTALDRGRQRYQRQDYKGALEAFSEAVNISSEHILLKALDHRAATYEKLGKLQNALRDAKEMIDNMPRMAKGYLRCGKVLNLKGESGVALKIYERGLTKVKIGTDQERTKLQQMYNKLRETQDPGRSRDPLEYLPLELAEMVVSSLTMRDKVVCLAVSKGWKRLLESSHKLWTILDTTDVKKLITQRSLKAHLRRSNWTLERAIITGKAGIDAQKMSFMIRNCKKLREIQIHNLNFIGDSLTSTLPDAKKLETLVVGRNAQISLSTVQTLLRACAETLLNASFLTVRGNPSSFVAGRWTLLESLQTLNLRGEKGSATLLDIDGLCASTPNVLSVNLNGFMIPADIVNLGPWSKLQKLDISNMHLSRWPILPSTLTHLALRDNTLLADPPEDRELAPLPLLELFDCHSTFISAAFLKKLTAPSIKEGHLKKLYMGGRINDFLNTPVETEFPAAESLEELSVAEMILSDWRMIQIVALYPNLKALDASSTKITGVAVKHFFLNHGIKSLKINECDDVGTDAIEWARRQEGVELVVNFPSRRASGRNRFGDSRFARYF